MTEPNLIEEDPNPTTFLDNSEKKYLPELAFKETQTNIATLQENTRSFLAKFLVYLLMGSLIAVALYILGVLIINKDISSALESSRELITLIWTSLVTLASGALGFYFGSNTKKD